MQSCFNDYMLSVNNGAKYVDRRNNENVNISLLNTVEGSDC